MISQRQTATEKSSGLRSALNQSPNNLLQRKCACGQHTIAGGECESCHEERPSSKLQRAAISAEPITEAPPIVHQVLRSTGQPLDANTRSFFEPRFGHDFGHVRVHTDARAAQSARAVNSLAYTVRQQIVFGAGQYNPEALTGRRLLAHELTHVVQQRNQSDEPGSQIEIGPSADSFEHDADSLAGSITNGESVAAGHRMTLASSRLQRNLLDVLTAPFKALARLFGAEVYSDDELLDYFKNFVAKGKIENSYDSDNKARAIVKRWKNNELTFTPTDSKPERITLDPSHKIVLGKEMYQGHRSGGEGGDIGRVLDLLRLSNESEKSTLISGMGEALLNSEKETAQFVAEWKVRNAKQPVPPTAAPPTAPAAVSAAPRMAEGIPYDLHSSFVEKGLSEENVKAAIGVFGRTDVANEVLEWLQNNSIKVTVKFAASAADLPAGEGSATGFQEKIGAKTWWVWVAAGEPTMVKEFTPGGSTRFVNAVANSKPQAIANTIFHELLHVWFKNRFPGAGTGHTEKVAPAHIFLGHKQYDEAQYDARFLAKLKEFDAQAGALMEKQSQP